MSVKLRRIKAGDPITEGFLNALVDLANGCKLTVGDGGSINLLDDPDGYVMDAVYEQPIWAKVTSVASGASYNFVEQIEAAGGTWTNGTLTDVFWEVNGNTSVATGKIVRAWRTAQGEFVANAGTC